MMTIPETTPPRADNSRLSSEEYDLSDLVSLVAGLERQKEELGPIAEELIDLLRHLGVGKPPPRTINPSSE